MVYRINPKNIFEKLELKQNKGVTMISLIITIIIMLILIGVVLNYSSGDSGIIKKSEKSKELTEIAIEREAVQNAMILANKKSILNGEEYNYIGRRLYDQNNYNSNTWDVIMLNDSDQETYGTGWSYVEKNTEIKDYGKTKYNWVLNYDNGNIKYLEEEKYQELAWNMNLAVQDYVFNMDSSNINSDISTWGDNVSLYYYDNVQYDTKEKRQQAFESEQKGKTLAQASGYDRQNSDTIDDFFDSSKRAFKFSGNNYIEIYNENGYDFEDGLTFEYYGKINGGVSATDAYAFIGFLAMWNGSFKDFPDTRMGYQPEYKRLQYSLTSYIKNMKYYGSFSTETAIWNQAVDISEDDFYNNNGVYVIVEFEPNEEQDNYNQKIFINGSKIAEGDISKGYYNEFLKKSQQLSYINIGRVAMHTLSNWCYLDGLCYTTRIYNRALTEDELQANYNKTVGYRKLIMKN